MKAWKAELALVGITFIWGGTFLFTKLGLNDAPPFLYIIIRFSIALAISLAFAGGMLIFKKKNLFKMDKLLVEQGLILGLFFGAGFLLQTYALAYTEVSKSAFITGITVILTPFVYKLVEKRRVSFWPKVGVVITAAGLWLFTNPDFNNLNRGDILTLFSTVFWALYITYMNVFTAGRKGTGTNIQLVMLQFLGAGPLAAAAFFAFEFGDFQINFTDSLLISLAFNGILASFVVTLLHTSFQRYTTAVKAALIFSLEPVIASLVAFIAINEQFSSREFLGAFLLLSGVMVSELGAYIFKYRKEEEPQTQIENEAL